MKAAIRPPGAPKATAAKRTSGPYVPDAKIWRWLFENHPQETQAALARIFDDFPKGPQRK